MARTRPRWSKSDEFRADRDRLADNLIAAKPPSRDDANEARSMEVLMAVIVRVAEADTSLKVKGAIRADSEPPTMIGQRIATPQRDSGTDKPPPEPDRKDRAQLLRDRMGVA